MFKKILEGKKAVCFDLDGTLVDSEPLWINAFDIVLTRNAPGSSLETFYQASGEPLHEKWKRVVDADVIQTKMTPNELTEQTNEEFLKLVEKYGVEPRDGFWGLAYELKTEKHLKLALTTNTPEKIARKVLQKMEVEPVFDFLTFGDQVKKRKPDPEIYNVAAKALGVSPKEVLVFEDSIVGAKAAEGAQMDVVVVWDGETSKNNFPKKTLLYVPDFFGLAGNLDKNLKDIFDDAQKRRDAQKV